METDIAYWARRAEEERSRANHAVDSAGHRTHTEFARAYERKVQSLNAGTHAPERGPADQAAG